MSGIGGIDADQLIVEVLHVLPLCAPAFSHHEGLPCLHLLSVGNEQALDLDALSCLQLPRRIHGGQQQLAFDGGGVLVEGGQYGQRRNE